jgi:hypothetical protein
MDSKEVILGDPDLVDISLQVGDSVFRCHKYPVARASCVLAALFRHDRNALTYVLGDNLTWRPEHFGCVLKSVYAEEPNFKLDDVASLLVLLRALQARIN